MESPGALTFENDVEQENRFDSHRRTVGKPYSPREVKQIRDN